MATEINSADYGSLPLSHENPTISESPPEEQTPAQESLPHDDSKRVVMVVTVPVKDKGFVSKKFMTLLTWLVGSHLTWAMHWALVVDKTAFELQRPRGRGKPYLKASIWPEEKVKDIISSYPVGLTAMTDEEILKSGKEYFSKETQPYYDLTVNNCQLFVLFATSKISPMVPIGQLPIGTSGQIAGMLLTLPSRLLLPIIVIYLRWWLGVDYENLNLFCALFNTFMSCCVSCLFTMHSQLSYMIAEQFLSMPQGMGAFIAFPIGLMTSFTMTGMFFLWPWLSWPHIQRSDDGRWVVFSRLQPLKTLHEQSENQQPPEEPLKSVPIWIAMAGVIIGAAVWTSIAIPFILRWGSDTLRNHISFRSPGRFLESTRKLLATPFVILEGEARTTVEALHPQALGAAEAKVAAKAEENNT